MRYMWVHEGWFSVLARVMYAPSMRRIQIYIDEELDDALKAESARSGCSKAALIRQCIAEKLAPAEAVEKDPITALIGTMDVEPSDIDDIVYGHWASSKSERSATQSR